jgi:hypothetical protein
VKKAKSRGIAFAPRARLAHPIIAGLSSPSLLLMLIFIKRDLLEYGIYHNSATGYWQALKN